MHRVSVDVNGIIVGFDYHDGRLDGLLLDGDGCYLAVRSYSLEPRVIRLAGLGHFHVRDVREGNVIDTMFLLRDGQCSENGELARSLLERFGLKAEKLNGRAVFWLVSSYGADLLAVCDGVEVSDIGATLGVGQVAVAD